MVGDRDIALPSDTYYTSLGYVEINKTTDFSFSNQEYTTVIPGTAGKAKLFITASMSLFHPTIEIINPVSTTYTSNNIQFTYNIDQYDDFTLWLDNVQDDTISSGSSKILSEGVHNFTIVASNTASVTTSTVVFSIDITDSSMSSTTSSSSTSSSPGFTVISILFFYGSYRAVSSMEEEEILVKPK